MAIDAQTLKYFQRRTTAAENTIRKSLKGYAYGEITELKLVIRNVKNMSAYDYNACMKAAEIIGTANNNGRGARRASAFKLAMNAINKGGVSRSIMMKAIRTDKLDGISLSVRNPSKLTFNNEHGVFTVGIDDIIDMMKDCHVTYPELERMLMESDLKSLLTLSSYSRDFLYSEYRIRKTDMGRLMVKATELGRIQWLLTMLGFIIRNKPIITFQINAAWLEENSQYPFEYVVESMRMGEPVGMDDYNAIIADKTELLRKGLPASAEHHVLSCAAVMSPDRRITAKIRNVNSKNISKWHIVACRIRLNEAVKLADYTYDPHKDDGIDGLYIISDMTYSPIFGNNMYKTMRQSANASIEYMNAIFTDDDSIYRWFVWLRAQRALRENRALVLFNENADIHDLYYSTPVFDHCPPEIIAWLENGIIPKNLTYDDIASMEMPADVIGRMQSYPVDYNGWLLKNKQ